MHEVISPAGDARPIIDELHFRRMLRRTTVALSAALILPVLLLLVLVILLMRSAEWVDHTDRAIAEATGVQKRLVTMQTDFRGFRLSNDPIFLDRLAQERGEIAPALESLSKLVADNAVQGSQVAQLRSETEAWFAFVDSELAAVVAHPELLKDPTFLRRGVPLFDSVATRVDRIIGEEQRLRGERNRALNVAVATLLTTLAIAAMAGIPALVLWLQRLLQKATESYRASLGETQLRARELAVTLSSIGDAVVATNAEGQVEFLNPAAEALMGWSSAEARGHALSEVFDIFNEQTGARTENPIERVLRENIVVGLANHTVLRARDGREVPIEDSAAPIRGEHGEVHGVILVFRDVSDRRAAERRLTESESRLRFLHKLAESKRALAAPAEIMALTTRLLGEHLHVSRCAYAEVKADEERFTILDDYAHGCASTVGEYRLSLFGPRTLAEMLAGRTLIVNDVDAEIAPDEGGATFAEIDVKAIICCPLLKEGTLRAMMAVHQTTPRAWTPAEITLVEEVVERCWA
ncbi:MAG: CHASE3 domain-containing protein, partial [Verrucomicrobiota bacterium]|nr:CHASE3 domain-containing protein [Verrucomicrobiota bacterium]